MSMSGLWMTCYHSLMAEVFFLELILLFPFEALIGGKINYVSQIPRW